MVDWRKAKGSFDAEAVAVMRFRAKITDVGCLNHFSRVISTIAKLAKTCILRLTLDKLYFILSDKVANGGVSMWCELNQMNFFDEFQMEGVSAENNEIYLELAPENLSRAFKTAQNAKTVKIKLTNKQCPCLTVAMELPSLSSSSRIVTHDIPVGVIPRKLWNDFREPSVPNFDVSIYLPVLKTMKCVVERMKNLSSSVVIEANLNGEMELKIETDLVCITTHFRDLGNPPWVSWDESQNSTHERDPMNMAEARIDIKRLLQFLAGQQVNPTKALCTTRGSKSICKKNNREEGVNLLSKAPEGKARNDGWKLVKERSNLESRRIFLTERTINGTSYLPELCSITRSFQE